MQCDEFQSAGKSFPKNINELLSEEKSHYNRQSPANYTFNRMRKPDILGELYSKKAYYSSSLNVNLDDLAMAKLSQTA